MNPAARIDPERFRAAYASTKRLEGESYSDWLDRVTARAKAMETPARHWSEPREPGEDDAEPVGESRGGQP